MNTRFRIAMVGPLPPEHSGIAEYSAGLVELLRDRGVQVHTVVRGDVERMGMQQVIDELGQADAIVYQMGNHPAFHGWMLPLMAQVPGIVHLHDLVLHHMVAGVLSDEGLLSDGYARVLEQWHCAADVKSAMLALRYGTPIWGRDEVVHYPLHQVATKLALEVVVHSRYAAERVAKEFPWLPVTVIPQLYPVAARHRVRDCLNTIAVMGGGQANRRFDWIVEALLQIDPVLTRPLTLEIAGDVEPAVQLQLERLSGLQNVRLVNHGRIDDEQFRDMFARADLMIALRQPTMGEASAVVSKALQAGLPVVVSDQAWYAELPSCVRKLPPTPECPDVLGSLLQRLALDSTAYSYWAEECKDQAGRPELDPYAATDRYVRLLKSNRVFSAFRDRVANALASLRIDLESPAAREVQRIDVRASLRGDRWVDSALAALAERGLDSYGRMISARVSPYPHTQALPPDAWQGSAALLNTHLGVVQPSSMLTVRLVLTNDSKVQWLSPSNHSVMPFGIYIGYFWHSSNVSLAPEQPRQWLEDAIEPASSGEQLITLQAPDAPGDYVLEVDLVQESVSWFKSRGFVPARLLVRVEAPQ